MNIKLDSKRDFITLTLDIISLDPGGTTGVAFVREDGGINHLQIGPDKHHLTLWVLLVEHSPRVLVCERFNYQRRKLEKGVSLELISREYQGIAELYCQMYPQCELILQNASEAKDFCDDRKMEAWGLDLPHKERHAKDAYRHMIYYDIFRRGNKVWLNRLKSLS